MGASRTAEILAEPHGCPVQLDGRLRECTFGDWEGQHRDVIKGPKNAHIFERLNKLPHDERIRSAYQDGQETPMDMALRAKAVADEAVSKHPPGSLILLVTHSTILESMLAVEHGYHFEGIGMRTLASFRWSFAVDSSASSPQLQS